ncbi:MAG: hypothetical protein AAGD10_20850 [Myxococcota bacterium]
MRITRRHFLWALVLASVGLLAAAVGARPVAPVLAILYRRLGYLRVESGSFEAFAGAYVAERPEVKSQLAVLGVASPLLRIWSPYEYLSLDHPLRRLEDNVVSHYLLRTDFFQHGAREDRVIAYLGNERAPCANPLARNYYWRQRQKT